MRSTSIVMVARSQAVSLAWRPLAMADSPVSRVTQRGYPGGINEEFLYAHPDVRAKVLDGKLLAKRIHLEIKDSVKEMVVVGKRCVTCDMD